jgi:hypothetical protein
MEEEAADSLTVLAISGQLIEVNLNYVVVKVDKIPASMVGLEDVHIPIGDFEHDLTSIGAAIGRRVGICIEIIDD